MAALAGLRIDNCEVWVNAVEMPGCDGSSLPFVEALSNGRHRRRRTRPVTALVVREVTRLGDIDSWIEARPVSRAAACRSSFASITASGNAIGRQTLTMPITPDSFRRELAPSRTFMLKREADWLVAQGSGRPRYRSRTC